MRALIEEFAAASLTPQELQERADRTGAFLEAEFGHRFNEDETNALRTKMRDAQAAHRRSLGNAVSGTDAA